MNGQVASLLPGGYCISLRRALCKVRQMTLSCIALDRSYQQAIDNIPNAGIDYIHWFLMVVLMGR